MARQTPVNAGFTIVNGAGTGANGGRIDVWMEYLLGEPNILENCTPVTVYFYAALAAGQHSGTALNYGMDSALKVDGMLGTGVSNGGYYFTDPDYINELGSFSANIYHQEDGTKQLTLEGSFSTRSSYISGGIVSAKVEIPPIARASTLTATDGKIQEYSVVDILVKNVDYSHSIAYSFGELSGFITADGQVSDTEEIFQKSQVLFQIPEDFYYEIPDAPTGQCVLTCITYHENVPVGQPQTAFFTVTAAEAACGPLLSGAAEDVNAITLALTGDASVLIPGFSHVACELDPMVRKGAEIVQMQVNGIRVEENTVVVENMTQKPQFLVMDSRGYLAMLAPPMTMLPYIPVTNNATVSRDDPTSGNVTVSLNGTFYNSSFGQADNALRVAYVYNGDLVEVQPQLQFENGVYTGSFVISGLDYTRTHRLDILVGDCLMDTSRTLTVQKGVPVFDWGEADFAFHVPVSMPQLRIGNMTLAEYIRQVMESGG